jgi:hypothetical protein
MNTETDCCDHDCIEGRACPVRKVKAYPYVPADDLPIQYVRTWRDALRDLATFALYVLALGFGLSAGIVASVLMGWLE